MGIERKILDIGIGKEGRYINDKTGTHEQRIGVDVDRRSLSLLKTSYPEVIPVYASAESLDVFEPSTFTRIEVVLPDGPLATPGLQNDHFTLRKKEKKEEYALKYPNGWYAELQRVLQPNREIIIYGDLFIDPEQVKQTSDKYFEVEQVRQLTPYEFYMLGTPTTEYTIRRCIGLHVKSIDKMWRDMLVEIRLRSKKTA